MPYKTTLPWRKFPRDTLHNPSLLFIINRMKEEHRQAVFTVFLGLYCEADDDGFVDISDEEFFADQCLTDADTLKLILQHFEKRHLIEKVAKDVPIYRIVDWLSPYPQGGGGKTAAERQKEYRERKKEEAQTHEETPAAPPVGEPATPATPAEQENSEGEQGDDVNMTDNDIGQEALDEQMSEDICALIKKGADLTDDELISQIRLYKSARKDGASREEAQEAAERLCSAPDRSEKTESEQTDTPPDSSAAEPTEKSVIPPVTGSITEHNALCNDCNALHNGRNALRPKIREEEERDRDGERKREVERERDQEREKDAETEREGEKETEEERNRQKETQEENPESGNAVQEPVSEGDYNDVQHLEEIGNEEQEEIQGDEGKSSPVSWITALWESVSHNEVAVSGLDEAKRAHFEALFSSHFKKTGGLLYSISEPEKASLRFLSIFLLPLADERNSLEVVASQFVGVLNNFIKKGVFFDYEKCTARTLCSSYVFEPVFLKVEKILQAKTGGGARWGQCLISCLKHLKAAEYAVMSIDSG
ncbi:hypothetical protein [Treponema sp. OMZ 855]|uniref:hypothetical protein n=1 Tax=Treponema sp. OMZ 855 TaxID=1643512 RepID=UPI0020A44CB5|nr:hypothetical protein [Treponema sp. OMZ 855]UTC51025.1 hypothetical protein E4N65_01380 [Treponema sp. OMZ 855]